MITRRLSVQLLLMAVSLQAHAVDGCIRTLVVDQAGNPLPGAYVRADRMGGGASITAVSDCTTDNSGKCLIEHLQLGEYTVNAGKQDADYPAMHIPFYRRGEPPKFIRVTTSQPRVEVSVTLGPKAGTIQFDLTDASTGAEIKDASIGMHRAANLNNDLYMGIGPHSRVLIPADDPVLIEITAVGYQPWHFESGSKLATSEPVSLHSMESRTVDVKLQPALTNPKPSTK